MERPEFDRLLTANLAVIEASAKKYAMIYRLYHEWEDLLQTVLLKMLRFADQYDHNKGALLPWACVIIINTIKTRIAEVIAVPIMEEVNIYIPVISDLNPADDLQASFILSNLNDETRLFVEGYNYPEIAAMCGVRSKATVMNRIDKCAKRLSLIMGIDASRGRRERMYAKNPD
ncbi:MAG: hypothetical protein HDS12_04350 [Bacteroides sp.]|nr:hypothetical protein [Bacteroides sp.]MBD5348814.1 hypothetical protein [Bacteroides sp.]